MQDALLEFGTINFATSNLTALGQVRFPDSVDLGQPLRDIGDGHLLVVEFSILTTLFVTGPLPFNISFCLWSSSNGAVTSGTLTGGGGGVACIFAQSGVLGDNSAAYAVDVPVPGVKMYVPVPPWPTYSLTAAAEPDRYLPGRYLVASAFGYPSTVNTLNNGTVSARLMTMEASKWRPHATGIVIA